MVLKESFTKFNSYKNTQINRHLINMLTYACFSPTACYLVTQGTFGDSREPVRDAHSLCVSLLSLQQSGGAECCLSTYEKIQPCNEINAN